MEKLKKILLIFLIVLLLLPSFTVFADEVNVPSTFYTFGIWNKYETTFTDGTNQDASVTLINNASAENTPTNFLIGFDVPLIEDITYSFEYSINSDNPTRYNFLAEQPTASWSHVILYDGVSYNTVNNLVSSPDNKLACYTEITSSTAQASKTASFISYIESDTFETKDPANKVYINFTPEVTLTDASDRRYWVTFSALKVYYDDGELNEETLKSLQEMIDKLEALGIKVDLSNEKLDHISSKLDDVQDSIDDVKDSVDNVGEDVAENLGNMEKDEGNKAQDQAGKDADKMLGDLSDSDEVGGLDIVGKIKKFWDMLSSTATSDSITFPSASNPFTGDLFWEEQSVDFSPWLNNVYVGYILKVARLLTSLGLLWWILKLYYSLLNSVLNKDSERSPIQVVLGLNPFK